MNKISALSARLRFFHFLNPCVVVTLVWFIIPRASAQDHEDYSGFDSIVRELSSSHASAPSKPTEGTLETVQFHLGLGLISTSVALDLPKPFKSGSVLMQGFGARFGIDLFSSNWVAEAGIRSFNPEKFSSHEISLREFDLLVLYHTAPGRSFDFNFGGGMTARYLDITGGGTETTFPHQNITPTSVVTTGFDVGLTRAFSIGVQISYRSSFVSPSADRGSIDGGLQLTGHL